MDDAFLSRHKRRAHEVKGETVSTRAGNSPGAFRSTTVTRRTELPSARIEPPVSALGPLFLHRLERIHTCRVKLVVNVSARPTLRVLGGYYRSRGLVRVYSHDSVEGRRSLEELFDTFLHEVAHHLEYTEPFTFGSRGCRRVPGLMHSRLFWRILGHLKWRWAELNAQHRV
jgi:hypothetical protein